MVDISDYKQLYLKTACELVKELHDNLMLFEEHQDSNLIEKIHIAAHSLKSQSLVMGYIQTGALALLVEHLFRDLKDKKVQYSPSLYSAVCDAVGQLDESLCSIRSKGTETDTATHQKQLEQFTSKT